MAAELAKGIKSERDLGALTQQLVKLTVETAFNAVPVAQDLFKEIQEHLKQHRSFSFSLSAFRRALDKSGIQLPKGQSAHVLRHTFASHFVMNGRDILTLQKVLGHSTVNMTLRYAHLAPDHLRDAVSRGPLQNFSQVNL